MFQHNQDGRANHWLRRTRIDTVDVDDGKAMCRLINGTIAGLDCNADDAGKATDGGERFAILAQRLQNVFALLAARSVDDVLYDYAIGDDDDGDTGDGDDADGGAGDGDGGCRYCVGNAVLTTEGAFLCIEARGVIMT
jgi:hypothetical protein